MRVWITILDYFYWTLGAFLGGYLGNALHIQVKGLDFVMTALFLVLAVEQFLKEQHHLSSISGFGLTLVCLLFVGQSYFMVVALLLLVLEYYFVFRRGGQES